MIAFRLLGFELAHGIDVVMIVPAYIDSLFPCGTFIFREVHAITQTFGTKLSIFSLKPYRDHMVQQDEARSFRTMTHYPALRSTLRAVPTLFSSSQARACVREVLVAYRARPWAASKAIVTLLLAAAIIPEIRRLQLRHVHAHYATMPALAAYFIKRVSGVPYSITAHAWDIYVETTMLQRKLQVAEFVVTCTAANCKELKKLGARPERLFLCYHGLDFDCLPPPIFGRGPNFHVLAVGRLVEQKGFAHLIKACHFLYQHDVAFECQIIGDGPLAAELRRLIAHYRLQNVVSLVGNRSQAEVFRAYREATVLSVPSVIAHDGNRDGIPNVILEAMSQGLPVVASRISGIPEVVLPDRTGWLVPPSDIVALAAALQEIRQAPQEAARRALLAYDFVRSHFDVRTNTRTLLELFRRLTPQRTVENGALNEHDVGPIG